MTHQVLASPYYKSCGVQSLTGQSSIPAEHMEHRTSPVTLAKEKLLCIVTATREPLAEYQARKVGLPKDEQYTFAKLITALCQYSYNAGLTIFTMLYGMLPLLDGLLYLTRFILDKIIEITKSESTPQLIVKSGIFLGELFIIFIIIILLSGLIIYPVWLLTTHLLSNVWNILRSA